MISRIQRVKKLMFSFGVHVLIVFNPRHVQYLSGFHTTARSFWQIAQTCCVLSLDGTWTLFLPAPWGNEYSHDFPCEVVEYPSDMDCLCNLIKKRLPTNTQLKVAADLSWMPFYLAQKLIYNIQPVTILEQYPILEKARMIKDRAEIIFLKHAVSILEQGLITAANTIRQSKSEITVQSEIDASMLLHGSQGNGFTTKVISGINGSRPHHVSGKRILSDSDSIIVDLSATVNGYESDSARTFLLPQVPSNVSDIHYRVATLLDSLSSKLYPGTPIAEVDMYIRAELTNIHPRATQANTIGHGVGLFAHEYPEITKSSDELLQKNMVLAIEPALYLPDHWGIRMENMFLIQENGGNVINNLPLILSKKECV